MAPVALESAEAIPMAQPGTVGSDILRWLRLSRMRFTLSGTIAGAGLVAGLKSRGLGTLDLVEDGAVAGVQHDAGDREQRAICRLVHQVAPYGEDMLARSELRAAQPGVLAQRLDRLLGERLAQ